MKVLTDNFVFSQSSLQTFAYCRHRFWLRFIDHLVWPAQISTSQHQVDIQSGTRFHQLVHQYFLGFDEDSLLKLAFVDSDPRIHQWLSLFFQSCFSHLEGDLYPESSYTIRLDNHILTAKVDLLHIDKINTIRIYDWKTSRKLPSTEMLKRQFQSMVYPVVISERLHGIEYSDLTMVYWEANFPDNPVELYFQKDDILQTKIDLKRKMDKICSLKANEFYMTEDLRKCAWCEYRSYCDRGINAAKDSFSEEFDQPDYEQEIPEDITQPWG